MRGKLASKPLVGLCLLSGFGLWAADNRAPIRFIDIAPELGIVVLNRSGAPEKNLVIESVGNGAAMIDIDNDQDLDLLLVNGSSLPAMASGGDPVATLYRNDGAGRFSDVTPESRLGEHRGWAMGVCAADVDNDGDTDLYLTAWGPNQLFLNDGGGRFTETAEGAGVADPRWGTGCAFGDYDRDGDLDLFIANYVDFDPARIKPRGEASCSYRGVRVFCGPSGLTGQQDVLYRNNGDGTFSDVSQKAGVVELAYFGFAVLFSDLDGDGWADIYVANDSTPNLLYFNNQDGTFTESGLASGTALSLDARPQAGMGADAADIDGDGRFDLFVTNFSGDSNTLYVNSGERLFLDSTAQASLATDSYSYVGWGTGMYDLDNDGWRDLFVANGHVYPQVDDSNLGTRYLQPDQVFRNLGKEVFALQEDAISAPLRSSRGTAFGDYDDDGDIDILIINIDDKPVLLRNETPTGNHWVSLRLQGVQSNRSAIGALVTLTAAGREQRAELRSGGSYLSQNELRLHFGLGSASKIERLTVRWPTGKTEEWTDLAADQFIEIREGQAPQKKD